MKKVALAALVIVSLATVSRADIIPTLSNISAGTATGTYNFNYTATLFADQRLDPAATASATCSGGGPCSPAGLTPPSGTFFTIYDIAGYDGYTSVAGALNSTNWTAFTMLTGATPMIESGTPDSNAVTNVSFFYNGPVVASASNTNLGTFVIGSTFGTSASGYYTAQATKNGGPQDGTLSYDGGSVAVPAGIPEPASMILIGSGLIGLAVMRRRIASRR